MKITHLGLIAALACLGAFSAQAGQAEQKTVETLYQDKAALNGHEVQLRGKVVKVNNGIMNRNFLHIQDGTGKEGSNDVTVTSDETASVGEEVTITGTLAVDKDFGAGYTYPLLIEQAKITKASK